MPNDNDLVWEAAWQRRDPAFDGRFFIAVRTTGIYCRCVCPVRLPLRRNVTFLPSAAAAEDAGYRPCLRCRPETAPFCPAWNGTRSTVQRAARLIIEDGALDGEGATVEALAARLGITPVTSAGCSCGIGAPPRLPWPAPPGCSGRSGC